MFCSTPTTRVKGHIMEDVRLRLRLPSFPLDEQVTCSPQEPPSPDSGFSSDDSSSSPPIVRQRSDRLRSALRRLPSGCRKKVRFGEAVVVQLEPYKEDYSSSSEIPSFSPKPPKLGMTLPNFSFRPESEHWQRARQSGICVSAIRHCGMSLLIQIVVHNRAFNKSVFIRWTTSQWESSIDQPAIYSHRATADIDIFTASLSLKAGDAELCVCYRVDGAEHWDNNDGSNYLITLKH